MHRSNHALATAIALGLASHCSAHQVICRALLSGSGATPANHSLGAGTILVTLDLDLVTMNVQAQFTGLSGASSSASILGRTSAPLIGTAGVAAPLTGFPAELTNGVYSRTIDLTTGSSYANDFISASGGTVGQALNALIFGFVDGRMYASVSSASFANGEISGFFEAFPDANHDGTIDTPDFVALAENFNVLGTELDLGDFNLDGRTNALDFGILAAHFGESVPFIPPDSALPVDVPEPVVLSAALSQLFRMRRPMRRRRSDCKI